MIPDINDRGPPSLKKKKKYRVHKSGQVTVVVNWLVKCVLLRPCGPENGFRDFIASKFLDNFGFGLLKDGGRERGRRSLQKSVALLKILVAPTHHRLYFGDNLFITWTLQEHSEGGKNVI